MSSKVETIPALDGLRVFATAGIFLFHAGLLLEGTFPVTLFFMLSGYMMYYTKRDTIKPLTGILKLRRLYPLHVLTFILSVFIWNPWNKYEKTFLLKAALTQLTLTQAWFSKYTMTYNGLAWYLSVTAFLYAISYPLVMLTRKVGNPMGGIILLLSIIVLCNFMFGGGVYTNPIYRVFDYLLGMMVAKQYMKEMPIKKKTADIVEMGILLLFFVQYAVGFLIGSLPGYYSALFAAALYFFSLGQGWISKILSHPIFHKLAGYSFEFYMIHELALRVFRKVFPEPAEFSVKGYLIRCIMIAVPALVVSVVFAYFYKSYFEYKREK